MLSKVKVSGTQCCGIVMTVMVRYSWRLACHIYSGLSLDLGLPWSTCSLIGVLLRQTWNMKDSVLISYQTLALVLCEGFMKCVCCRTFSGHGHRTRKPFLCINSIKHWCGAVPLHGMVDGGGWNLCEHVPSLCIWGGFWEADNTGRSSWSVSLAQRPLCCLSEDLIIHEHLKSFQFIKHLSSKSHVGSVENMVLHCFIKVNMRHFLPEGKKDFINLGRFKSTCLPW